MGKSTLEPGSASYHMVELDIVRSENDPRRCVPGNVRAGSTVLDVGCGIGQTLSAGEFAACSALHDIDVDEGAVRTGRSTLKQLRSRRLQRCVVSHSEVCSRHLPGSK